MTDRRRCSLPKCYRTLQATILVLGGFVGVVSPAQAAPCVRCGWSPPPVGKVVSLAHLAEARMRPRSGDTVAVLVRTMAELRTAVQQAQPGMTILLADGTYHLDRMLDLPVRGLVLRGQSGHRERVVLRGDGMTEKTVGVALSVSAPDIVIADLTVGHVGFHGIQVRGEQGAARVVVHNVLVLDTGQQLLKGSIGPNNTERNALTADDGLVACSTFAYTNHAPSNYTNGVDVLGAQGWVVRDNYFLRIRGVQNEGWSAGPALLFWTGCANTLVERNLFVDCYRGIALGLVDQSRQNRTDHHGGVIRNNVVCNLNPWADEAIEVNDSPATVVEHNTVLVEGKMPWSISIRFAASRGVVVRNNLSNHQIALRDGAQAELQGNVITARRDWFVDPGRGILRLTRGDLPAIDAGVPLPTSDTTAGNPAHLDFGRQPRPKGKAPDAGAFEYDPAR